jgi:excisionase family DNA binding protein
MTEYAVTPDRLLTPEQVADRLSLSVLTVRAWLRSGRLPGVKPGGRVWRVRESDLDAYIRGLSRGDGGSGGDGRGS